MRFRHQLSKGCLGMVAVALGRSRQEGDFADIGLHHDIPRDSSWHGEEGEGIIANAIGVALNGLDPGIAAALAADEAAGTLEPIYAELIAHLGIDPNAVAVLQRRLDGALIIEEHVIKARSALYSGTGRGNNMVAVEGVGFWYGTPDIHVGPLPATMLPDAFAGLALSEVVRHPVLDRHDIIIDGGMTLGDGSVRFRLITASSDPS